MKRANYNLGVRTTMSYITSDEFKKQIQKPWSSSDYRCDDAITPIGKEKLDNILTTVNQHIDKLNLLKSTIFSNQKLIESSHSVSCLLSKKRMMSLSQEIVDLYDVMIDFGNRALSKATVSEPYSNDSAWALLYLRQFESRMDIVYPILFDTLKIQNQLLANDSTNSILQTVVLSKMILKDATSTKNRMVRAIS